MMDCLMVSFFFFGTVSILFLWSFPSRLRRNPVLLPMLPTMSDQHPIRLVIVVLCRLLSRKLTNYIDSLPLKATIVAFHTSWSHRRWEVVSQSQFGKAQIQGVTDGPNSDVFSRFTTEFVRWRTGNSVSHFSHAGMGFLES